MGSNDKELRKRKVIEEYLPQCTTWNVYTYGSIPKNKYVNACSSYAGRVLYENVYGLIDETIFGSGKAGMLFTTDRFYSNGNKGALLYADGISYSSLPSTYNLTAMNEMLQKLYEIETEPSGWQIAGSLLGSALGFLQEMAENSKDNIQNSDAVIDASYQEIKSNQYPGEIRQLEQKDEEAEQIFERVESICLQEDDINVLEYNLKYFSGVIGLFSSVISADYNDIKEELSELKLYLEDSNNMKQDAEVSWEECYDSISYCYHLDKDTEEFNAINLKKVSKKCLNKINFYLAELNDCEEDEGEEIMESCKHEMKYYQKKYREARIDLKKIVSEM